MSETKKTTLAVSAKRETVDVVADRIHKFQQTGQIYFPANYSPENALKSAWLIIQETVDKNQNPALAVCTKESVVNCLLDMVIQGLNPTKKQCYFIVYGNKLQMQRSYFGTVAVAKQVNERVDDIIGEVIYKGDVFKTQKVRGKTVLVEHQQEFENIDKSNIIGAYATILYKDGTDEVEVMTMPQIQQAWRQSKMGVFDDKGEVKSTSTHGKFTDEMCKKTVINRAAKRIINTSDDHNILMDAIKRSNDEIAEDEAKVSIAEHANADLIDVDVETGEVLNLPENAAGVRPTEASDEIEQQPAPMQNAEDEPSF